MDIELKNVHRLATSYDVTRAIAEILHGQSFVTTHRSQQSRPVNFQVVLKPDSVPSSIRNGGAGTLTVPDARLGHRFLGFLDKRRIRVRVLGRIIYFVPNPIAPRRRLQDTLAKVCVVLLFFRIDP